MLGAHLYTFRAQETQDSPQVIPPEVVARLYCHAMVSAMPDQALPDLVENLHDLELQFLKPAQPSAVSVSSTSKITAKVGKPVARPEFYLDGE